MFYTTVHRKTNFKKCKAISAVLNVIRHIHSFKASFVGKFQFFFFMMLSQKSIFLLEKEQTGEAEQKLHLVNHQEILVFFMECSAVSHSAFFYPCRFRLGDILIVCLVFKFFPKVVDGFVQAFLQWNLQRGDQYIFMIYSFYQILFLREF